MLSYEQLHQSWQLEVRRAGKSAAQHHTLIALVHYLKAIDLLESLIRLRPKSKQSITGLLVSYHRLADLYIAENSLRLAWSTLVSVRQQLKRLISENGECAQIRWGYNNAHCHLQSFEQRYGTFTNGLV